MVKQNWSGREGAKVVLNFFGIRVTLFWLLKKGTVFDPNLRLKNVSAPLHLKGLSTIAQALYFGENSMFPIILCEEILPITAH